MLGMEPTRGGNADQIDISSFLDSREEDRVGEHACPYYTEFYCTGRFERGKRKDNPSFLPSTKLRASFHLSFRVGQQHTQKGFFLLPGNDFICLRGIFDGKAMGDKRANFQLPIRH